jgi:oligopeptide/dipeptide ABC transporter ATP-binding protein
MRQRAMIAAALIARPDLLVADEPTTALDVTVQAQILELLHALRQDTALLLITHDLGVVAEHTERMLVLERGHLVESGTTQQVFSNPQHAHTRALLKAAPRLDSGNVPEPVASKTVLAVNGATVSYREAGKKNLTAVRDIDFTVSEGETVAIVGESGSGKSSLVRAILGLIPADAGTVSFYGTLLEPDVRSRSKATRRDLQLVFQNPIGSLNPQMRVEAIVSEPLSVHEANMPREKVQARVVEILEQVGLSADYLMRYAHELSGGQAQRVAIARALILEPKVLVCDEAVAALDGSVRQQILELLTTVQQRTGLSILFISHDLGVVRTFSHRVLVMYLGRLVELAANAALFTAPQHPYTRALIDAVPIPNPQAQRRPLKLPGEIPSILSPPGGCAFHPRCRYADERCNQERPAIKSAGDGLVACHRSDEI